MKPVIHERIADRKPHQDMKRAQGLPCYCDSLSMGACDFCTGLAPLDGARAEGQIKWQKGEVRS